MSDPKAVRDPRFPAANPVTMEDPRYPVPKDLIALQRRWLIETTRRRRKQKAGNPTKNDSARDHVPLSNTPPSKEYAPFANETLAAAAANRAARAAPGPHVTAKDAPHVPDAYSDLTMLEYRYTKGSPIVNESLGYGERITDLYWQPAGVNEEGLVVLKRFTRVSQRTKSGRQVMADDPPKR